ncbi:hypothetical protein [Paenibacillus kobensis]|uniref:hypothetical protein n=1 Tax=Paenibacillus kobensis TaxID=59841 RepID=UPI000FD9D5DA|nr:hypothetical protein [Paenibacillus kobensis]
MQLARFLQNKRMAAGALVVLAAAILLLFDSFSKAGTSSVPANTAELKRAELNVLIDQWQTESEGHAVSSNPYDYMNTPALERMTQLSADYLPYIVERMEQDQSLTSFVLTSVVTKVSQAKEVSGFKFESPGGFVKQWKKFEQSIPSRYTVIRDKAESRDGSEEAVQDAVELGVLAVPYIMEDIRAGRADLAPAIAQLLPSEKTPSGSSVKAWKKWVNGAGEKYGVLKGIAGDR